MAKPPVYRNLRVLAFDPSLAARLETSSVNRLTLRLPWEENLQPGPIGEYIEVVDIDPASDAFYPPVNLNDPYLLAQEGLSPSESDPQFHQQMVYAVAMSTIRQFERALGRVALWSDYEFKVGKRADQFVRRLRIYPHALRDRNAYYSPTRKALLFGYFPVASRDRDNPEGTVVFTCLSHDIIAHETTHALLDGLHPRFGEASNPDVRAFHEAFADIVALFQHFSYPSVLESQISRTRGNLQSENLLSQLAQQFGQATGRGSALRDALGGIDPATKQWKPRTPNPQMLETTFGPHERGSILVAAIFRAFLTIYGDRTADLFRIATGGTGRLPEGEIHPDLTRRLAREAAKCADRVLQMCIRALDYCPPVDITFGDFLRGVVTADLDFNPEDDEDYRTVFIQSFREWGIQPRGVTSLGMDALVWPSGDELQENLLAGRHWTKQDAEGLHSYLSNSLLGAGLRGLDKDLDVSTIWSLESERYQTWKASSILRKHLYKWLREGDHYGKDYAKLFGLVTDESAPPTVYRKKGLPDLPTVEVHSVRPTLRRTLRGSTSTDLVVEITQRRRGYFDPKMQEEKDRPDATFAPGDDGDFKYRAGCTLLIDTVNQKIRYVIRTAGTIADNEALERMRRYHCGEIGLSGSNAFDAGLPRSAAEDPQRRNEPFALMHREEN